MHIIGADIGGHHIAAARVDIVRNAVVPGSYRYRATDPRAPRDRLLTDWAELLREVVDGADMEIGGIGIAMPGPFDYLQGTAWFEINSKFETLHGVNIRDELIARGDFACVMRFLNDATSFTVGCHRVEAQGRGGRIMGVTLGTGLGGAFLQDGVPVIADPGRVPPGGCLWDLPYQKSIADDYVSARWIIAAACERLGYKADGVADVAALARRSDDARAIFEDYGAHLGAVIAPWVKRFGADTLVIGGRITGAFDLFAPTMLAAFDEGDRALPLIVHENTEDAAIIGVAATFDPSFWEQAQFHLPER